jgi:Flp pilus assembly protein TadD
VMRITLIILVSMVCACSGQNSSQIGSGQPGLNVASAALAAGSPEIALKVTEGILAKDPNNVPALLSQADAQGVLGRADDAKASYTKVLSLEPGSVGAQIGLGRFCLASDPARAQSLFLTVLQRDPGNKIALNDLGIAYDLQGDHVSAQGAYRHALGADPTMRAAEVNLALSMALNGRASEAVRLLKPLASAAGASRRLRQNLAAALAIAGDKQGAAKILNADMTAEQAERALVAYKVFSQ